MLAVLAVLATVAQAAAAVLAHGRLGSRLAGVLTLALAVHGRGWRRRRHRGVGLGRAVRGRRRGRGRHGRARHGHGLERGQLHRAQLLRIGMAGLAQLVHAPAHHALGLVVLQHLLELVSVVAHEGLGREDGLVAGGGRLVPLRLEAGLEPLDLAELLERGLLAGERRRIAAGARGLGLGLAHGRGGGHAGLQQGVGDGQGRLENLGVRRGARLLEELRESQEDDDGAREHHAGLGLLRLELLDAGTQVIGVGGGSRRLLLHRLGGGAPEGH
mmetsp:Transcript_117119/g.325619  ORF Transcript_117119/g.325619 Transcript_117119/m.325619 type:complete len:272 (-) Transcript_117119:61-876(-)